MKKVESNIERCFCSKRSIFTFYLFAYTDNHPKRMMRPLHQCLKGFVQLIDIKYNLHYARETKLVILLLHRGEYFVLRKKDTICSTRSNPLWCRFASRGKGGKGEVTSLYCTQAALVNVTPPCAPFDSDCRLIGLRSARSAVSRKPNGRTIRPRDDQIFVKFE